MAINKRLTIREAKRSGAKSIRRLRLTDRARNAMRRRVSSRPKTSSDSKSGGPTRLPVTATRMGACALPKARSWASPISAVASCNASRVHSQVA